MKRSLLIGTGLFLAALVCCLPCAHAAWSTDPAVNLDVADRTGDQAQPKIAPTADGGCYISWFDNAAGGYDVYLQRLDAAGDEQWAHNGVLIADRSFSSTEDYGLDVDSSGNAVLAFRDDRFGSTRITAAMVDPAGALVWGANGIQLTSGAAVYSPRIAGTSDGYLVVGWTEDAVTKLQKLDAAGAAQWGTDVVLADTGSANFSISDIHGSDAGNVIVSWVKWGPQFYDPKHLWAQKISPVGATMWNTPGPHVIVFDGDSLQFGNYPTFITDGSGGAVFSWYGTGVLQCYAQQILTDGSEQFTHNGISVSTNATRLRVSPRASFDPDTGMIYVFWTETNSSQSQHGVYGQKLSSLGLRLWTTSGKELVPVGVPTRTFVNTLRDGDGAMAFYIESPSYGNDVIKATRVDGNGDFSWTGDIVTAGSLPSGKGRLNAAMSSEGYAILAWSDDRPGHLDIIGQNVNADGTLGYTATSTVSADLTCLPGSGTVPFTTAFSVTINSEYSGQIRRMAGRIDVVLANGSTVGNWRTGYTNIADGGSFVTGWNTTIPAFGTVIGTNTFTLAVEDVTPSPFNQPPYPPAGDTTSNDCTVEGIAP